MFVLAFSCVHHNKNRLSDQRARQEYFRDTFVEPITVQPQPEDAPEPPPPYAIAVHLPEKQCSELREATPPKYSAQDATLPCYSTREATPPSYSDSTNLAPPEVFEGKKF